MKKTIIAAGLAAGLASATTAWADLAPPPGAILDVAALQTFTTAAYTQYSVNFIAGQSTTFVSFLFRRDPSYFAFDDASVAGSNGINLLVNPGFEDGPVGSIVPAGWGNFQQTTGISAIGVVQSGGGRGGEGPHGGSNFWDDGSVGAYDGIYQLISTTIGQSYTLSFFLANPVSGQLYSQTGTGIDVLAYAGDALPDGSVIGTPAPPAPPAPPGPPVNGVPEPDIAALIALGAVGAVAGRRKSRR